MPSQTLHAFGDPLQDMFADAPKGVVEQLRARSRVEIVHRGECLMREGEASTRMCFILQGVIGMVTTAEDKASHVMGLLLPGDSFGRMFNGPMPHSIEVLTDAVILAIDRGAFEQMLRDHPEVEHHFIVTMLNELDAARTWVMILSGTRVLERVAAFIAILFRRLGRTPPSAAPRTNVVQLPLSRNDISRCLGIRKESLSRALHRLAEDGLIRLLTPDRIEVPDLCALVEASGNDLDLDSPRHERRYASPVLR